MSASAPPLCLAPGQTARISWHEASTLQKLGGLMMVLVILHALTGCVADPDLWGYLAFGRLFWETGHFPYHDTFAYVPTLNVWVYHEWLTGVIFYPINRYLGALGLQLLKYVLGLTTVWLIYLTARRRGAGFWSALLGLWFIQDFLSAGYSPVRAQIFTYLFFALSLFVLETARLTRRWRGLGFLVLIQVFWCNLHAGFLAGLGLLFLYALGEAISGRPCRPYLATLAAAILATLINPYGTAYWFYLVRAVTMPRPDISEWASLIKAWQCGLPKAPQVYYICLALISGFLVWWARWRDLTASLILALTFTMGFLHIRHQAFFLVAAGVFLPVLFDAYGKKLLSDPALAALPSRLGQVIPAAVMVIFICIYGGKIAAGHPLSLTLPPTPNPANPASVHYPVGAAAFMQKNHLTGKILNEFTWGEYLIWTLAPSCQVAMDGRYETVYRDDLYRLHTDFYFARSGWHRFLEKYPPDLILVDPRSRVYPLIKTDPDWRQVYSDAGAAVFLPRKNLSLLSPGSSL